MGCVIRVRPRIHNHLSFNIPAFDQILKFPSPEASIHKGRQISVTFFKSCFARRAKMFKSNSPTDQVFALLYSTFNTLTYSILLNPQFQFHVRKLTAKRLLLTKQTWDLFGFLYCGSRKLDHGQHDGGKFRVQTANSHQIYSIKLALAWITSHTTDATQRDS